jgi:hypothetical protein
MQWIGTDQNDMVILGIPKSKLWVFIGLQLITNLNWGGCLETVCADFEVQILSVRLMDSCNKFLYFVDGASMLFNTRLQSYFW